MFVTIPSMPIYTLLLLRVSPFHIIHSHSQLRKSKANFNFQKLNHQLNNSLSLHRNSFIIHQHNPRTYLSNKSDMSRRGNRGLHSYSSFSSTVTSTTIVDGSGSLYSSHSERTHFESGSSHGYGGRAIGCSSHGHGALELVDEGDESDFSDKKIYGPLSRLTLGDRDASARDSVSRRHTGAPSIEEARYTSSRHPDSRHTDSRPTNSRYSSSRPSESRQTISRHPSSRPSESRQTSSQYPSSRQIDYRPTDSRHPSSRPSDSQRPSRRSTADYDAPSRSSRRTVTPGDLVVYGDRSSYAPSVSRRPTDSRETGSNRRDTDAGGRRSLLGPKDSHRGSRDLVRRG